MSRKNDRFFRLKYMGYCMAHMPPDGVAVEFDDFVNYAKFQLCRINSVLEKDPVWDRYTDEQILVEYYATLFHNSEEERTKIEAKFAGDTGDVVDWFDKMIEKNQEDVEEIKRRAEEAEDEISFNPENLGD